MKTGYRAGTAGGMKRKSSQPAAPDNPTQAARFSRRIRANFKNSCTPDQRGRGPGGTCAAVAGLTQSRRWISDGCYGTFIHRLAGLVREEFRES